MFNNAMLSGFELYPRWVPLCRPNRRNKTAVSNSSTVVLLEVEGGLTSEKTTGGLAIRPSLF